MKINNNEAKNTINMRISGNINAKNILVLNVIKFLPLNFKLLNLRNIIKAISKETTDTNFQNIICSIQPHKLQQ